MTTTDILQNASRSLDVLQLTLSGLDEDLQDFRTELLETLENYEARLYQLSSSLPEWVEISSGELRKAFFFFLPHFDEETALGPRLVCSAASCVEQFVSDWFGDIQAGLNAPDFSDEASLKAFESQRCELTTLLRQLDKDLEAQASSVQHHLDMMLENLLNALEDHRETDIEALESLVHQGELEPGRNARAEIAQLWEEQRFRAGQIRQTWSVLEDLVKEGIFLSQQGLSELTAMFTRLQEGFEGAYPELVQSTQKLSAPSSPPREPIDDIGDTIPTGSLNAALPHPTQSTSPIEPTEPTETMRLFSHDDTKHASPTSDISDQADTTSEEAPRDANSDDIVGDEGSTIQQTQASEPLVQTTGFRVQTQWVKVSRETLLLTFSLPTLIIGTMLILSLLYILGVYPNPLHDWPWTPYALIVALIWTFVVPFLQGWHVMWQGIKPTVIELAPVEDINTLVLFPDRLVIGDQSWPINRVHMTELYRWDAPKEQLKGWLLVAKSQDDSTFSITTWEESQDVWQNSPASLISNLPEDCWRVDPTVFSAIHTALG